MDSNKTNNSISQPVENVNNENEASDSDADDEDFVPNEANEGAESEEISDGDDDDDDASSSKKKKTARNKSGKKRKAANKPRKSINGTFKRRRFQRNATEDSNDEEDVDFIMTESRRGGRSGRTTDDNEEKPSAEQVAEEDAADKADTDRLWANFLTSVNEEKDKRKKGQERTVEKIVNKVVDFAGEKISVQERVKVTVSSNSNGGGQDSPSSSVSTVALSDVSTSNASGTTRVEDEPVPGPSSAMTKMNGEEQGKKTATKGNRARRGGISILGNDPETIGLDELDKRGLTGLLKAFQNKAAAAKRIGTLEKSKLDWEQYKRKQGLEDELTHHNKSRDTFIDKQEFLQRTDHRQFELEKNMRATARSRRLAN